MNPELEMLKVRLEKATGPEEIFGPVDDVLSPDQAVKVLRRVFGRLAKICHPDHYLDKEDIEAAGQASTKLTLLWKEAQERINRGSYGSPNRPAAQSVLISTGKRVYSVFEQISEDEISNLYRCSFDSGAKEEEAAFRVVRDPQDNDLLQNEARVLTHLRRDPNLQTYFPFVPELLDSFSYKEGSGTVRQANILPDLTKDWYSLEEVRSYYKDGIDPKDMAWMWRRVLLSLGFSHERDTIHGALTPNNILIHPQMHGLILANWSYSVIEPAKTGERITAISEQYRDWYPKEIFSKNVPLPGLDIYMGAKSMVYLLGGDPLTGKMPKGTEPRLEAFFKGCILEAPGMRPQNAWSLIGEFFQVIEKLWGKRRFRQFHMPAKS